jgi:hypothetical protein
VPRKGEINAWDNVLFQKTVRETGRTTLIIAGVWTSVCVAFPALDAKAQGFNVYTVHDASVTRASSLRASRWHASRKPGSSRRARTPSCANSSSTGTGAQTTSASPALYTMVAPNYGAVIESYVRAQQAAKEEEAIAA